MGSWRDDGTAETEAAEFFDIYKLDVVVIPRTTDGPRDANDVVYNETGEYNAGHRRNEG